MKLSDQVIGLLTILAGKAIIAGTFGFREVPGQQFGSAFFLRNIAAARTTARPPTMGPVFAGLPANLKKRWRNLVRGSLCGSVIGALPGAGADIAAWVAYAVAKRRSLEPEKFGTGHDEGIVETGAANNGALSGAWVPTLVFGIPGDSITAIVIGVLYLKGLEPGPVIFIKTPELVYAIFLAFHLANLLLIPFGWMVIRLSRNLLRVPPAYVIPVILACCMVGSFAINNTLFGVGVMLVFGLIGWLFEENGIPVAPAILGIVLGNMLEFNFVISMLKSDGNLLVFVERPIGLGLAIAVAVVWLLPLIQMRRSRR